MSSKKSVAEEVKNDRRFLTMSIVFSGKSLNYGESEGNLACLKLCNYLGEQRSRIDRVAIKYSMKDGMGLLIKEKAAPVSNKDTVCQLATDDIAKYIESDFFGYMNTEKGKGADTRSCIVFVSDAMSMYPYEDDINFQANISFAKRAGCNPNPSMQQIHSSKYTYTISIDLEKVSKKEGENNAVISDAERCERILDFIEVVKHLKRSVKAQLSNMSPEFIIGGVYSKANPFFDGGITIDRMYVGNPETPRIKTGKLSSLCDMVPSEERIYVGYHNETFANEFESELKRAECGSVAEFFSKIEEQVKVYYGM